MRPSSLGLGGEGFFYGGYTMDQVREILGVAKAVSDLWGITPYILAFLVIALVAAVINRFFDKS